eukprot:scaffold622_cov102-Cylindrotheca_fusiformis.AAC.5
MTRRAAIVGSLLLALSIDTFAFVVPSRNVVVRTSNPRLSSPSSLAAVPVLENWRVGKNGAVIGIVSNHPTIPNGDKITTSPLKTDAAALKDNMLVVTKSGSKYKLGKGVAQPKPKPIPAPAKSIPKPTPKPSAPAAKAPAISLFPPKPAPTKKPEAKEPEAKNSAPGISLFPPKPAPAPKEQQRAVAAPKPAPAPQPAPIKAEPAEKDLTAILNKAKSEYNLNGKTIGNGKYVLVGKQIRSSSTRSQIFYAYKADADGLPTGPRLTVKLSPTAERLERENRNYNSITNGIFSGQFVNKLEFLPRAQGDKTISATSSALVLQSGERNLRTLLDARRKKGLSGTPLRQAAVAIAQCLQAIHSSGLVWTDLKAENFVVISDSLDKLDQGGVKGIDLESAVPVKGPPVDYSPEACPPEFAKEESAGRGASFVLQYNYDVWSLGVLLYELAVGSSLFGNRKDGQITSLLRDKQWEPDTSAVPDDRLRDLIDQCLQLDPSKRPSITQILLHPYFLTTGIGPFSF